MKIPAWMSYAFKIVLFLLSVLTLVASTGPQYVGGSVTAAAIIFWVAVATTSLTGIYTILGTGSVPSVTTLGKVAGYAIAAALSAVVLLGMLASAQAAPRERPVPTPRPAALSIPDPGKLIDDIRTWIANDAAGDLDLALKIGNSEPKNPVTVPCFQAIRDFVTRVQNLPTSDKMPKIHLAVDIEILTDLEIQLLPNSPTIVGCTALANFQAVSAQNIVTGIVSGALALSKFAPVVPPI